jgi:hypothetical protein
MYLLLFNKKESPETYLAARSRPSASSLSIVTMKKIAEEENKRICRHYTSFMFHDDVSLFFSAVFPSQ